MTLRTWKDEFYPTEARRASEEDAVSHSLQKWIGLRETNLEKHGLSIESLWTTGIVDSNGDGMTNNGASCALCAHYYTSGEYNCLGCPLMHHLKKRCDMGRYSLIKLFIDTSDPEPMIDALSAIV